MSRPTTLYLPSSASANPPSGDQVPINTSNSIVIIGANGSGKTRLGVWLELTGPQQEFVHRVGAQKSLAFPDSVSPVSLDVAEAKLFYGVDSHEMQQALGNKPGYKRSRRWKNGPATRQLDDYSALLIYLFSDEYEVSLGYRQRAKSTLDRIEPTDTKLDKIKRVWEQVLPHRELIIRAGDINARPIGLPEAAAYKAADMSDGERVCFYLIGQCLAAPANGVIVVDEPEIHLHRVIQARLWDAIEQERPDCLFVYLTHDLDFAASRTQAKKIWIKSYDGGSWDWKEVPTDQEGLPEEVLLAVLGSRKPILFTEGDRGCAEQAIFSHVYPGWTIMPRGGCEQVIKSTQAFRALRHLHGIDCHGIVDLDYRTTQEVAALQAEGIHVLETQEIENLLLVEPVLQLLAVHAHANAMVADAPADIISKVKDFAFGLLSRDKALLASRQTAWELETQLHKIDRSAIGIAALEKVRDDTAQFDVAATYTDFERSIEQIIDNQDYTALLKFYNNKGLAKQVGKFFGTQSYPEIVKRLLSTGNAENIVQALRAASPALPAPASTQV